MAWVLVTGGGGFLGSAIVRGLIAEGYQVRSYSRKTYDFLQDLGVVQVQGDLGDGQCVSQAVKGCEMVFHCAAKAGVWGPASAYERTNVLGTKNIIAACRSHSVERLIFTSSPSVVFAGRDQENVNENEPYPKNYLAHYPRTKAYAERMVNMASGPDLATVSLRPHLIWGPGDPHLVPRIVERGRVGKLRLVGHEDKLVDSVYVDNAAKAHIQAAQALHPKSVLAGKNYFITNGEPRTMADLLNGILAAAGLPPVNKRVSSGAAFAVGSVMEAAYRLVRARNEPIMTRFVARQLSTAHWFDISAAKKDFGYDPEVKHDAGLHLLRKWLQKQLI